MHSFAILLLASTALAAFSPEQISFVFSSTKALKGASFKAPSSFDFTLVANSTHALCALQLVDGGKPGASATQPGWIGIGGGASMIGSDDLVFWQSSKGDWVVSRREPNLNTLTTMKDPGDAGASSDGDFALVPELSSSKGSKVAQVAFIRKLDPSYKSESTFKSWKLAKKQPFIFARSSTVPDVDVKSTLAFHDINQGQFVLDLSKSIKATRNFGAGSVLNVKLPTAANVQADTTDKKEISKTVAQDREANHRKNATVTSSAYDPNDTPDFCDMLAAKNVTANGPCGQQKKGETVKTASSSSPSSVAALVTTSSQVAALASAVESTESSSASSMHISMILMIVPFFALLLS